MAKISHDARTKTWPFTTDFLCRHCGSTFQPEPGDHGLRLRNLGSKTVPLMEADMICPVCDGDLRFREGPTPQMHIATLPGTERID